MRDLRWAELTAMPRYRLRFLLQELDLTFGVTTIGRSEDCHVTLDDPLVSRQHARIIVRGDRALVEDTASRNGVTVNDVAVRGVTWLRDGDRVRVGARAFVFCQLGPDETRPPRRATAELRLCASCRMPHARELLSCPSCEDTEQIDEDTLTGNEPLEAPRHVHASVGSER